MKIKTSELTGPALDWVVGKLELVDFYYNEFDGICRYTLSDRLYNPSEEWAQGGPIIERERITVISTEYWDNNKGHVPTYAASRGPHGQTESYEHVQMDPTYMIDADDVIYGPTPLIAAMRCLVSAKLGDEVEVPDELVHPDTTK